MPAPRNRERIMVHTERSVIMGHTLVRKKLIGTGIERIWILNWTSVTRNYTNYEIEMMLVRVEEAMLLDADSKKPIAHGAPRDLRKDTPYLAYAELDFEVPVGIKGDNYDRYYVRMREMDESVHMIRQCVDLLPDGPNGPQRFKIKTAEQDPSAVRAEGRRGSALCDNSPVETLCALLPYTVGEDDD